MYDDEELQEIRGAFLNDTISALEPADPICLLETATVAEAIARMLERRQAGVLIVAEDGRLAGIFTERDVLMRVVGAGRDAARTVPGAGGPDRLRRPLHERGWVSHGPAGGRRPETGGRRHGERRHPLARGPVPGGGIQPAAG